MTGALLHIVCYRWGTKYGVEYVNKLRSMVARHLRRPHLFHCVTDEPAGLSCGIIPHRLPDSHFNGNWNKLMTFQPDFLGLAGETVVCLDLDVVIVNSVDFVADSPGHDFVIARNWARGMRGNSSVFRVKVGSHAHVWEDFARDPESAIDRFHGKTRCGGDQRWLNHAIERYEYFEADRIVSFKRHCDSKSLALNLPFGLNLTTAVFGQARVPANASIILFHGEPLPPHVAHGSYGRWKHAPFVGAHWH